MAEIIQDELLGEIKCVDGFETKIKWIDGKKLNVYFDLSEYQEANKNEENKTDKEKMEDRIETLKKLLADTEGWNQKIIKGAAKEILEEANDWFDVEDYYDEDEIDEFVEEMKKTLSVESAEKLGKSIVTEEALEKNIKLTSLTIYAEGSFGAFLYDDEMFFGGHLIVIGGNLNGEFSNGDIAG